MVSEDPSESDLERCLSFVIRATSLSEVPDTCCSCNNELRASSDESRNPEEAEEVVDPDISCSLVPLDIRNREAFSFDNFTDTEHKDC
jgi:hypothetical protein